MREFKDATEAGEELKDDRQDPRGDRNLPPYISRLAPGTPTPKSPQKH
jgi:hypothetical protein